jgi:hypothetical protein
MPVRTSRSKASPIDRLAWSFAGAVVLFLAVFACWYADERLYTDASYYLARVINQQSFHIEHGRYVLALSQILGLMGSKLSVPMSGVIILHSLNNVLWLMACVAFVGGVLRNNEAVALLAAVHLIGLTHGLFCPMFELYYGVDLLIVFYALLQYKGSSAWWRWPLMILCWVGCINSHLFGLALALGLLVMARIWEDRRTMWILLALAAGVTVLHTLTLSVYERDHLEFLNQLSDPANLVKLVSAERLGALLLYLRIHYPDTTLLGIGVMAVLVAEGRHVLTVVFVGGAISIHLISGLYKPGFYHDRYLEQVNFAMVAWILIALCFHVLPVVRYRKAVFAVLFTALCFRIGYAAWVGTMYQARTAHLERLIDRTHQENASKRIILAPRFFGTEAQIVNLEWSASVESLLLSAKAGPAATVSLITTEDVSDENVSQHLDQFVFRRWEIIDTTWLDRRYFKPPTGIYVVLPE